MLKGKKILLGITASIAAYKIPFLIRLFIREGAEVQVLMTPAATDFVTPLTCSALSGNPCLVEGFNPVDGTWNSHVDWGNWADLYLIAPVTAVSLSKMCNGLADNLLVATYLAAKCPVFFAPAMDLDMYKHPSTKANIERLQHYGNYLIEPTSGELASGLCGAGRMEEPEEIVRIISAYFKKKKQLAGKKVLITAGPTFEAIDPVRFIGNHSSGKMGFALAEECASIGADVTLVSGPVSMDKSLYVKHIDVVSADEMYREVLNNFDQADIVIMAAAVADYRPENPATDKIKKKDDRLSIQLIKTTDILAELGKRKQDDQILAGFALETSNEMENAEKKLRTKNLDMIVLNSLRDDGAGFGVSTNKVTIIKRDGKQQSYPQKDKRDVAKDIISEIVRCIESKK
jgi:phosphopantothenoylcysteine decarboxylase/phosphopantothenate--cysteine ligase